MILDGKDIGILVSLYCEGARAIELDGDPKDIRRRLQRLRKAGLCGCSPQQGYGGHPEPIWGINPDGIEAIKLSEAEYPGKWREKNFTLEYQPQG